MSGAITKALQQSNEAMSAPGWLPWGISVSTDTEITAQPHEEPADDDPVIGEMNKSEHAAEVAAIHNYTLERVQVIGREQEEEDAKTEYETEKALLSDRRRWRTNSTEGFILPDDLVRNIALGGSPCKIYAQLGKLPAADDPCIGMMNEARLAEDAARGHNLILQSVRRHERQEISEWEPEKVEFCARPMTH